jgi:ribosomal protein L37E
MAEAAQQAQHEFWRPPMRAVPEGAGQSETAEACDRCGTEFIVGSRYCHSCGASRPDLSESRSQEGITLTFSGIAERLRLSTAPFIAFLVGIVCVVGAAGVGVIFNAHTVLDWQAVQLWRIEWLLGAVAAFVAGCLLKQRR